MYSAKEAAKITGLSTAALRYYEKESLLPPVKRNDQKYRQYTNEDIEWIRMIQCMRMANIPIQSIKEYVSLLIQGGKTLEQRYEMVQEHIKNIMGQIANLQKALTLTQSKLDGVVNKRGAKWQYNEFGQQRRRKRHFWRSA